MIQIIIITFGMERCEKEAINCISRNSEEYRAGF